MALSLDATASATATTATSNSFSLTTASANTQVVLLVLTNTNGTSTYETVSSATLGGTGMTKRGFVKQINSLNDAQNLEWWYGPAASSGSHTLAYTLSGAPDISTAIAFSVTGASTYSWDTASSGGIFNNNSTSTGNTVTIPGCSTVSSGAFSFSFVAVDGNIFASFPCNPGAPWAEITDVNNSNTTWGNLGGDYQVFSTPQSSFTKTFKTGGAFDASSRWIAAFDSVIVGGATPIVPHFTLLGVGA